MSKLSALSGQQVVSQSDELTPGTDNDEEADDEQADLDIELQSLTDELQALDTQLSLLPSQLEARNLSVLSDYRALTGCNWSQNPHSVRLRCVYTI